MQVPVRGIFVLLILGATSTRVTSFSRMEKIGFGVIIHLISVTEHARMVCTVILMEKAIQSTTTHPGLHGKELIHLASKRKRIKVSLPLWPSHHHPQEVSLSMRSLRMLFSPGPPVLKLISRLSVNRIFNGARRGITSIGDLSSILLR